jgi:hypothetical protein
MLQTSNYEVLLESRSGQNLGWVGENEVNRIDVE